MNGINKNSAEALINLLNAQIISKDKVKLSSKELEDGTFYISSLEDRIKLVKGDEGHLYKLLIGGTDDKPAVVIQSNTYDGIANLFNSIEAINN